MNALTIIALAKSAQWVLELAEKEDTTLEDWRHINQLAAEVNRTLFSIEQDGCLRPELRTQARELHLDLLEVMRRSCAKVELQGGFGYPKHKPDNLEFEEARP